MIQPRLGATWAYNGKDTVYASYAKYNPAASSLPRAASWDRNVAATINAYFDANGVLFATDPGRLLVRQAVRRRPDAARDRRVPGRHRPAARPPLVERGSTAATARASHFWEDTNNDARVLFNPPRRHPPGALHPGSRRPGGPRSAADRATSSPSSTAPTRSTTRPPWSRSGAATRPSSAAPTPGATTTATSTRTTPRPPTTLNIFIGSSNIGGRGGPPALGLQGRRPPRRPSAPAEGVWHPPLPWNGSVGVYVVVQSGQPWEAWSYEPYRSLTTSTSDTNRYAEPAGLATIGVSLADRPQLHAEFQAEGRASTSSSPRTCFNVFNKQTGYNIEPRVHNSDLRTAADVLRPAALPGGGSLQF